MEQNEQKFLPDKIFDKEKIASYQKMDFQTTGAETDSSLRPRHKLTGSLYSFL